VDLSTSAIDLTRKDIRAEARWFSELVKELAELTKAKMRGGVLKVGDSRTLLTKT